MNKNFKIEKNLKPILTVYLFLYGCRYEMTKIVSGI